MSETKVKLDDLEPFLDRLSKWLDAQEDIAPPVKVVSLFMTATAMVKHSRYNAATRARILEFATDAIHGEMERIVKEVSSS